MCTVRTAVCQSLKPLLGCSAVASQRRTSQSALSCRVTWLPPLPLLWCDFRMCFFRSKLRQKPLEQISQVNGLTSLCVCIWNVKLYTCKQATRSLISTRVRPNLYVYFNSNFLSSFKFCLTSAQCRVKPKFHCRPKVFFSEMEIRTRRHFLLFALMNSPCIDQPTAMVVLRLQQNQNQIKCQF